MEVHDYEQDRFELDRGRRNHSHPRSRSHSHGNSQQRTGRRTRDKYEQSQPQFYRPSQQRYQGNFVGGRSVQDTRSSYGPEHRNEFDYGQRHDQNYDEQRLYYGEENPRYGMSQFNHDHTHSQSHQSHPSQQSSPNFYGPYRREVPYSAGTYPSGDFAAQSYKESGADREWEDRRSFQDSSGPSYNSSRQTSAGQTSGHYYGRGPKNYQRSDDALKEEVCEKLTWSDHIDASDIDVEVKSGVICLKGEVDGRRNRRLAEELVENIAGAKDVKNELRVKDMSDQDQKKGMSGSGQSSVTTMSKNK